MSKRKSIFIVLLLSASLFLGACGSLLEAAENAVQDEYGPAYVPEEHQTRTFDTLWKHITDNYIHYGSADVDWDAVRAKYEARIAAGLTNEEFTALLDELEAELPSGTIVYQSRQERIEADTTDFSTYEGIGAIIGFHEEDVPHVVILDVIDGSPAELAGLRPHDSIYAIDGSPVLLEEGLTVVNRIRGPAGSTVTLNVKTPGKSERTIEVKRGKLTSAGTLEASILPGTQYGYILVPPISYNTMSADILKTLGELDSKEKLAGLILDLRIAGSSRGFPLEDLLTLFSNGEMGEFFNSLNQVQPLTVAGVNESNSQKLPLVILVGRNTSGFPEVLAAILQHQGRAIILGETTPGAIETTDSFYLPDGSRVFIETTSFRLSDGTEIGKTGIQPDVSVEASWDDIQPSADPVIKRAAAVLDEK
jgi:carboxyl-terminal processing protease